MSLVSRADALDSVGVTDDTTRSNSSGISWVVFFLAFAILGVTVPGLLLAQVPDVGRSAAGDLALLLAVWCGLRLSMLIAVGQARFFAFFVWLFTYIFMGIAPAVQIRSDQPSTTTPDVPPASDLTTMWIVLLGVACFEIGTLVAWLSRRSGEIAAATPGTAVRVDRSAAPGVRSLGIRPAVTVALAVVGLGVTVYYVLRVGRGALFASREAATAARITAWPDSAIRAIVLALAVYPLLIGLGGLVQLLGRTPSLLLRIVYLGLIGAGFVALLVAVNPISSARYTLGTVVFALLVYLGTTRSVSWIRLTMTGLIVGLFFIFPLADAFRIGVANFDRAGFFGEYGGNPDYDSFWQVANANAFWQADVNAPGWQALGLLTFWMPRSLWPGKPLDTGIVLGNFQGYSFTNLSAPLWAEALVNGGILFLVVVFLVLGYAVRRLDGRAIEANAARRTGAPTGIWFIVGAVFPAYLVILMRGSLLQAFGVIVVIIVCLLLIRQPRTAPETSSGAAPAGAAPR